MQALKPNFKRNLGIFAILLLVVGIYFWKTKIWDNRTVDVSDQIKVVGNVSLPNLPEASLSGNATKLDFPSKTVANNGGTKLQAIEMTWQSHNGWHYANGGMNTTKGSLFDKCNLDVEIKRMDDCVQSSAEYVAFCKNYKNDPNTRGVCVTYMGSGIANYASSFLAATKELGADYAPIVFVSSGKSAGEDQWIGDAAIRDNPQLAKGQVVIGVKLDGDMDIPIRFCNDNKIKFNPNAKYYDYDALNAMYPSNGDFKESALRYNEGTLEKRRIVQNGKTTDRDTMVAATMVATWFPADGTALNGTKGGATIMSTKEYASMMPNITIFCKKWVNDHRDDCVNLVTALAQAGDQIRSFEDAKRYACKLNVEIYGEGTEKYWYDGYTGFIPNKNDKRTHIGGSMVFNLQDMANLFGLGNSKSDVYKAVYTTFGTLQGQYYPEESQLHPYMDYNKLVDKSIIMTVMQNHPELLEGKALQVDYTKMETQVSSRSEQVQFNTGSSEIQNIGYPLLDKLYTDLLTTEGLKIKLVGHTDNTGNSSMNISLSEQRAESVKAYFIRKGISPDRIVADGKGDTDPIAPNNTESGRALNRRVQIILLN